MKPLYIIVLFFGVTLSVTAQDSTQYSAYELLSSYYDNDFKPFTPKKWFVGLSFSLSDQTQENTASLLSKTLKAESNSFSITAKVGRFVGDYFLVGGNFELSQERYDGQIISDNDTISRQSLKRQYGVIPTIRTYFPLVKNERFSFFNDINVGFKYGTELIRDTKNLDEIEKANPDVFNLLLQIFDHGTLTDTNGRKTDFRNVIIVMTTNAGADRLSRASVGFTPQDHSSDVTESIKKMFNPEFRNRLDAIIHFNPLDKRTISNIVDKFLIELEAQLDDKKVTIEITEGAREWLAANGYDKIMGARPMSRLIQKIIKRPLAEELLFGKLMNGGHVVASLDNNLIKVEVKEDQLEQTS